MKIQSQISQKEQVTDAGHKKHLDSNEARSLESGDSEAPTTERQLESPLNALINQRERLFLDEMPDIQLEMPVSALINQREPLSLSEQAAQQQEYLLNAQMNQREQQHVDELPRQLEPPINALINRHKQRRFWRTSRDKNTA